MPRYRYIAVPAAGGAREEISIEADSPQEAAGKLRGRAMLPLTFLGEEGAENGRKLFKAHADGYEFTSQLAPLLAANIPLERALAIIVESAPDKKLKDLASSLRQGLHEGKKFSDLIRSCGSVFPPFYANLIETGEETGCLPEVAEELRRFMSESRELKDFIVSSSIYPCVVLGVTVIVVILLFTVFVPRFAGIFADMGRTQPPSMVFLQTASTVMLHACWSVPLLLLAVWSFLRMRYGMEQLRLWRSILMTRIPIFGQIIIELEMGRFIRTLAILVSNHVEIIRTVRIAIKVINNQVIRGSFGKLEGRLRGGEKLSAALADNPYLPPGLASRIRVGEETGAVGPMLERSAGHMEEGTRRKIKRLLSMFEPLVIVFLAVVVLVVVVSIFMAIMEINSIE